LPLFHKQYTLFYKYFVYNKLVKELSVEVN